MTDDPQATPAIARLSRRDFVTLTAAAVGEAVFASTWARAGRRGDSAAEAGGAVLLPEQPSLNPAYLTRPLPDDGLLLWTMRPGGELLAYRLNGRGRLVWSLCDGTRQPEEIAREYARRTGRRGEEGATFLHRLLALGVVAAAAHVVPEGNFPRPPRGGCYHRRLSDETPGS